MAQQQGKAGQGQQGGHRGISLPCPCCGEAEADVLLSLGDGETFTCRSCENEFTREDVESFISRWSRVLAWMDSMPSGD